MFDEYRFHGCGEVGGFDEDSNQYHVCLLNVDFIGGETWVGGFDEDIHTMYVS